MGGFAERFGAGCHEHFGPHRGSTGWKWHYRFGLHDGRHGGVTDSRAYIAAISVDAVTECSRDLSLGSLLCGDPFAHRPLSPVSEATLNSNRSAMIMKNMWHCTYPGRASDGSARVADWHTPSAAIGRPALHK